MSDQNKQNKADFLQMNWKKTALISLLILFGGAAITFLIFMTEPTAERSGATRETAMLVDVITPEQGDYRPTIRVTGTVRPAQDIILSPRVSGEIISRSESFVPGTDVTRGETLFQIDPADYENTLQLRESELRQAEANLKIEMGRQDVAQQDYQLLDESLSQENESLVLREPQLNSARSQVEAARAAVNQAELDLQRTTIRAPFDAHILSRNVNVGSQVSPGQTLGRLVGIEEYWVEATVPLSQIQWLAFPQADDSLGSEVRIRNRTAWTENQYRSGYLLKMLGALEDQTRLARVLICVPDPLSLNQSADDHPPLIIGAFVEAAILAKELPEVIRLNRDYIRKNETVWVMADDQLQIRDVDILFNDANYAYISDGLNEADRVVITNLTTVVDGAALRVAESDTGDNQTAAVDTSLQN